MRKYFLIILILVFSIKAFSQNSYIAIIDPAIGLSQSELKIFLRGILNGREPGTSPNTDKIIYTLDNVDTHTDYYIDKDSCLSAGIRFKNEVEYKKAQEEIESTCPQDERLKNTYYKISKNKRIVYYRLDNEQQIIIALEKNFMFKK